MPLLKALGGRFSLTVILPPIVSDFVNTCPKSLKTKSFFCVFVPFINYFKIWYMKKKKIILPFKIALSICVINNKNQNALHSQSKTIRKRSCKIQCTFYCHRIVKMIAPLFGPQPLGSNDRNGSSFLMV